MIKITELPGAADILPKKIEFHDRMSIEAWNEYQEHNRLLSSLENCAVEIDENVIKDILKGWLLEPSLEMEVKIGSRDESFRKYLAQAIASNKAIVRLVSIKDSHV